MDKKLIVLSIILSMSIGQVFAEENVGDRKALPKGTPTVKEQVITVPSGVKIQALTTYELNSKALLTGQTVTLVLPVDFYHGCNLIAPRGSILTGNIVEAARAKQNGANGKLNIRFSLITTPYGLQIPIVAMVKTKDESGVLVGGKASVPGQEVQLTSKKNEPNLLNSVWNFGDNVVIPVNTGIDVVLLQPITVNPTVYSTNK